MLPWSVMPTAGWPSAAAAATTSPTRAAPSSIENSVCRCRWVNESGTGEYSSTTATTGPYHHRRLVPARAAPATNYTDVVLRRRS